MFRLAIQGPPATLAVFQLQRAIPPVVEAGDLDIGDILVAIVLPGQQLSHFTVALFVVNL